MPATLEHLRGKGYTFLASVHGVDYFPEEPRLGVHYELLDMKRVDRITVKTRVHTDAPDVPSVTPRVADRQPPGARGLRHVRRRLRRATRTCGASSCPRTTRAIPQRRDFPIGGEPILFTHNEPHIPGWWK